MENKQINEVEEVSFLDLFLVLVRYRNLIIIGTILSIIFSICVFYIKPKLCSKASIPQNSVQKISLSYDVKVQDFPFQVQNRIIDTSKKNYITVTEIASKSFNKVSIFAEANKVVPLFVDKDDSNYNNIIQDVMANDYKAFISETSGVITVKLSLPKEKETLAGQFIDSLVTLVDKDIKNYFFPMLDMYETSVKQFIEQANSRKDNSTFAQNERLIYTIETSFRQNLKSFLYVSAEPFSTLIIESSDNSVFVYSKKKIIFTVAAGFFFFVIIAFIVNGINNVKSNENQKKLVSEAWNFGKWRIKNKNK